MITFNDKIKTVNAYEFKPGMLIEDSGGRVILVVKSVGVLHEGCFAGIYLNSMQYSDQLKSTYWQTFPGRQRYVGWELYEGSVTIDNEAV